MILTQILVDLNTIFNTRGRNVVFAPFHPKSATLLNRCACNKYCQRENRNCRDRL